MHEGERTLRLYKLVSLVWRPAWSEEPAPSMLVAVSSAGQSFTRVVTPSLVQFIWAIGMISKTSDRH